MHLIHNRAIAVYSSRVQTFGELSFSYHYKITNQMFLVAVVQPCMFNIRVFSASYYYFNPLEVMPNRLSFSQLRHVLPKGNSGQEAVPSRYFLSLIHLHDSSKCVCTTYSVHRKGMRTIIGYAPIGTMHVVKTWFYNHFAQL